MSSAITIRINNQEKTVHSKQVKPGQGRTAALVLQVSAGHDLQFIDQSTGRGPRRLVVQRVGDDLHITLEGGEIGQPDVVVQNYYDGRCNVYLLGEAADGKFYTYAAENGQTQAAVGALGEAQMAAQTLGGSPGFSTPWWTQAACAAPWAQAAPASAGFGDLAVLGGLGALGLLGAASLGGKEGEEPLDPPTVAVSADGLKLSGSAKAGATVRLDTNGDGIVDFTAVADATGHYEVDLTVPLVDGQTVTARAVSSTGATSPEATALAPDFPIAVALSDDGHQARVSYAAPGSTVTITDAAGQVLGTAVAGADGTATVPLSTPQLNGEQLSASTPTEQGVVQALDLTPPVLAGGLTLGSNSGAADDQLTNDNTPTLSGQSEPGALISVQVGGQTLTAVADANGAWSVTPEALADGSHDAVVTARDAAGNTSSQTLTLVVDTAGPALAAALAADSDSGAAGDSLTSDNTPTLSGSGEPGTPITVEVGGQTLSTTVGADGRWSVTPDTLADGDYSATITSTDAAGNSRSTSMAVTVDTALVLSADLSAGSDTGAAGDSVTRNPLPTLSGMGEPGAAIAVTVAGQLLNTVVGPDGTWSVTPTVPLADGVHSVSVSSTDPAGNSASRQMALTVDMQTPELTAALATDSDTGLPGDGVTRDTTPTLSGTGEPGSTIEVVLGGQSLSTTVAADGTWSITPQALADGPYVAQVTAVDAAGNRSAVQSLALEVDTQSPALSAQLASASDTGLAGDGRTSNPTPTISGTGEPGAHIELMLGGQTLRTTVAPDGSWSVNPTALADGDYTATVTATDAAGNSRSASVALAIDTGAPALTAALAPSSDSGLAGDGRTSDPTPTLSGTGEAGALISVVIGGQTLTTTVAADGSWSVTPAALADGDYTAAVTTTDAAGNRSSASVMVAVDTGAPALTAMLDAASNSGLAGDSITNDPTPTLSGTAEAGAAISVVIGGQTLTTTAAADGRWSVTPLALADASYSAAVTATDAAGNSSTAQVPVTVDTSVLALSAALDAASDTGLAGDGVTQDPTPTLSGAGEPGASVVVQVGGQTLVTTVTPAGTWSVTAAALADGNYSASVTETDVAGNTRAASVSLVIDNSAPVLTALLNDGSDSGLAGDGRTNDPTPTISGTGEAGARIEVMLGGQTLTTTVAADGRWSVTPASLADGDYTAAVTATDAAGNSRSANVPVSIDTQPPVLSAMLDAGSDTGTLGDNRTNLATPAISGTGEPGARIAVQIAGQTLTTVVDGEGHWSVTPTTLADGVFTATVTETDAAGNTSTASVTLTIDTTALAAPQISISTDANNDGFVNGAELAGAATLTAHISLPPGAVAGDTLRVSNGTSTQTIVLNAAQVGAGGLDLSFTAPNDGSSLALTATVTDRAGNLSAEGADATLMDLTDPVTPTVTVTTDGDNNGYINGLEFGSITTVTVTVGLPSQAQVGDTLFLMDGVGNARNYVLTAAMVAARSVVASFPVPAEDAVFSVTAQLVDPAGNSSSLAADSAQRDTFGPDAPVLSVLSDANNDGFIGVDEIGGPLRVSVALPGTPNAPAVGDTLTITGGAAGPVVIVLTAQHLLDGVVLATVPMPAEGAALTLTATLTDLALNVSPASFDAVTVDTTAPTAPVVTIDEDGNNDGYVSAAEAEGQVDVSITLNASNAVGDSLTVMDSRGLVSMVTLTAEDIAAGVVHMSFAAPTEGSELRVWAFASDLAGNASADSAADTVRWDTLAPTAPVAALATASDTGASNSDRITRNALPTLTGTGNPGDTITVFSPTEEVMTTVVAADGTWSVTPTFPIPDGAVSFSVTATDPAGNVSPSTQVPVTIDTVVNAFEADLRLSSDSGVVGDNITRSRTPTFSGTGEPGSQVTLTIGGQTLSATVAPDGTWSVTAAALADGDYPVVISQTDVAGNTASASGVYTIDNAAPVLTANLDASSDSGVAGDSRTNDTTPTLSGTGEVGANISVVIGGQTLTITVSAGGTWSVTAGTLAEASYVAAVTETDAAGNTTTGTVNLSLDTTAPVLTAALAAGSDSGTAGDGRTNDPTPTISGTGEVGASISVVIGGQTLTTTVAADGTWSVTSANLLDGSYSAAVTETDAAGNPRTATVAVVIDTAVSVLTANLDTSSDSGVSGDSRTSDTTPTLSGTGEVGANISVVIGGQTLTTTVSAGGTWSVTPTTLVDGAYSAAVTATDVAGNSRSATVAVTVDTNAPAVTAALASGSDSGAQGDGRTNDLTPTLSGTGEPGAAIQVVIGGQTLNTTVAPDGSWSVTPPTNLAAGTYSAAVTATDAAGNFRSATVPVVIDNIAPTLSSSGPADNATNVLPGTTVTLNFNETVQAGTGNQTISLYSSTGTLIESFNTTTGVGSAGGSVSFSGGTATLNLHNATTPGSSYYVQMGAGAVTDSAGNPAAAITGTTALNFTTAAAATITVTNLATATYSSYLHSIDPNFANTNQLVYRPGSTTTAASRFGTAMFASTDDAAQQVALTTFGNINLFGTTYSQVGVGSNGFITFGATTDPSYGAANIPAYTGRAMLAVQLDDFYNGAAGRGGALSAGGTSMGTNRIYFDQYTNAGSAVMQYTMDDVGYFQAVNPTATDGLSTNNYTTGNALQLRLIRVANGDIAIQMVYENVSWVRGNTTSMPSGGWTDGTGTGGRNGTVDGNIPGATANGGVGISNTFNFLDVERSSNVGRAGIWEWYIGSDGRISTGSVPMLDVHQTATAQNVASLAATGYTATYAQSSTAWDSRFVLTGSTVSCVAGSSFSPSETSVDLTVMVTSNGITYPRVVTVQLFDHFGNASDNLLGIQNLADITELSNAAAGLTVFDGRAGIDTLAFTGQGLSLNMTNVAANVIDNVERIDLGTNNTITLALADVMEMGSINTFNSANGWVGLAASEPNFQLVIDHVLGGTLDIANSAQWNQTSTQTVTHGGVTYNVFESVDGVTGMLLVETGMTMHWL